MDAFDQGIEELFKGEVGDAPLEKELVGLSPMPPGGVSAGSPVLGPTEEEAKNSSEPSGMMALSGMYAECRPHERQYVSVC